MENIWSTTSVMDERSIGSMPSLSIIFFLTIGILGTIFFLFYPLEDTYRVIGQVQKERIQCIFPTSKLSYLKGKYIYIKGKHYKYKVVNIQIVDEKRVEVLLEYKGKEKNPIVWVEWRRGKQTIKERLFRSFRKEEV